MLPILQSSGLATVQSPLNSDGAGSHEIAKDFQRSERFSSLVRDSGQDSEKQDTVEEKADENARAEPADEPDLEVNENHRQGEGDTETEEPGTKNAGLEGSEAKDVAKIKSDAPKSLAKTDQIHFMAPTTLFVHTENDAPIIEATTKLIEARPGVNVLPGQTGLNMEAEPGHSDVSKPTIATEIRPQQKNQVAVSITQEVAEPALADALDLSNDRGRQDSGDLGRRAKTSSSQLVLGGTTDVDTVFRYETGGAGKVPSTQRWQVEAIPTDVKSSAGKKPNSSLGTEQQITVTHSKSMAPAIQSQPTPPALVAEPRRALQSARAHDNSRIRYASDLADLTSETEPPQLAKKPLIAGLTVAPLAVNETATLGQRGTTILGNDEWLQAGLGASTETLIQSTQSEAVSRSTQVHPNELPRHIARQLAEVSQRVPDRPVEVSLNPEELGRVRMSISAHDTGITMSLLAERQETLDLMRRHIDQLAQEFHALGFGDVRFSFSQKDESADGQADLTQDDPSIPVDTPTAEAPIKLSLTPSAGLDLRL